MSGGDAGETDGAMAYSSAAGNPDQPSMDVEGKERVVMRDTTETADTTGSSGGSVRADEAARDREYARRGRPDEGAYGAGCIDGACEGDIAGDAKGVRGRVLDRWWTDEGASGEKGSWVMMIPPGCGFACGK